MEPKQDPWNPGQTEAFFRWKTVEQPITLAAQLGRQTVLATSPMGSREPEMGQEPESRVIQGIRDLVYPPGGFQRTLIITT